MDDLYVIVLAAGKGTRMGGKVPKVLLHLYNRPIIFWTLDLLKKLKIKKIVVVTGYKSNILEKEIKRGGYKVEFVRQDKLLGTAHAVKLGLESVPKNSKFVVVLYGDDSGLYKASTIKSFIKLLSKSYPGLILTTKRQGIFPLGGLRRNRKRRLTGLLTRSEIEKAGLKETEILCGVLGFEREWLEENIKSVKKNNMTNEYPLPALIEIAAKKKEYLGSHRLLDKKEWASVNTDASLEEANRLKRDQMKHGKT